MKLGLFTVLFPTVELEQLLPQIKKAGVDAVEIGTGNYPGDAHCPLDELLAAPTRCKEYKSLFRSHGVDLSCLSCHGNPLHPDRELRKWFRETQRKTIRLAEKLGVKKIVTFSGCPGDGKGGTFPNWVTCPWPEDYTELLQWQWENEVLPFWSKEVEFARDHGLKKLAIEMHPGFVVYNPRTLIKLRKAVGPVIGANLDPSHMFWQGIDPIVAVQCLGRAVFHVHAKDTKMNEQNIARHGVLDTQPYGREMERSWTFRTVGWGHGVEFWTDFLSALRLVGYDDVISIEHEDSLMSPAEGFQKAVAFLNQLLLRDKPNAAR